MQDSKYDPRKREMHGRWELIFPFSQKSEDLSLQLNKFVGCNNAMGAPQLLKVLVQEVREHQARQMTYAKQNYC